MAIKTYYTVYTYYTYYVFNVNIILVFQESFRMTNFTRVIITIQWNTKMCLMELAHHQPRLLDPLLHLLLHRHAFLQLRICGLYPYQISFAIWLGKTPGESRVYYIYYAYYLHYGNKHLLYSLNILYVLFSNVNTILVSGVISDDELHTGHHNNPMEHEDVPDGARTPPTPPARSPPPRRS